MSVRRPAVTLFVFLSVISAFAQTPDRNVNMVSGTQWPGGDPWLQRQNEPSVAASTRNPLHLLAGANDYRTVDIPGLEDIKVIADAWLGVFRSYDGGSTWTSTLMPGYPQDTSAAGMSSPLKGYPAGADPVVRAGASGLFYYTGIVLNRDANPLGALFVTRYLDHNNKESSKLVEESAHSIRFVDTKLIQRGTSGQFNDKPWIAVDIPRDGGTPCTVAGQTLDGGNVYLAWTTLVGGDINVRSKMSIARSVDCGNTWESPIKLSETHAISQGASIAIDPATGNVYVVWRRIESGNEPDALLFSKSVDRGRTFSKATVIRTVTPFEQGTTTLSFRTTAFPSMAVDGNGRIHVAWSERSASGDGRIMLINSMDGVSWSAPAYVSNHSDRGHQFMPTLAFANGKLTAGWYDQREDHTTGIFTPIEENGKLTGQYAETRRQEGHLKTGPLNFVFNTFIQELASTDPITGLLRRHTLDVFVAEAPQGSMPAFTTARASQYYFGSRTGDEYSGEIEQMQFSAANLPLFRQGTTPFIGDYLDVAPAEIMKKGSAGWSFSVEDQNASVRHVVWTDNRDVRPPLDGNWRNYTPVAAPGGTSIFDSTIPSPKCVPGQTGMRNQNIYTTRITDGLFVGSPGNSKPFKTATGEPLQRAFVVFAQNTLRQEKSYRLTIMNQPVGGKASFLQLAQQGLPDPLVSVDVTVPPRSSIARTVFATSSEKYDDITVSVEEIAAPGAPGVVPDGLSSTVVLNPDIANPDIANPDIANPDIANPDIANAEVYNPDIANPDIANPDIANPDIANPDIANPDIANPDIANPDIANPDIANPDIANPDIANPDIANPDIANGSVTDTTWETTSEANTAASFSVNLLLNGEVPDSFKLQLILHRIYTTPVANGCERALERHTVLFANINNPEFQDPDTFTPFDVTDPSATNATIWMLPGETMRITLRVVDPIADDDITFSAGDLVAPVIVAHAINTLDLLAGGTTPPVSFTITTRRIPDAITGLEYVGAALQAVGGIGARTWASGTPAPPTSLNISESGFVNGTADVPGSYLFNAVVTDSATPPNTDTQSIFMRVVDPLDIPAQTLPTATDGTPYTATLTRTGGAGPFTWSLIDGAVPDSLELSPNGVISGIVEDGGVWNFTVQVTDSTYPVPQSATRDLSITIGNSMFLIFAGDPPSFIEGQATPNVTVRVRDSSGAPLPGVTVTLTHAPNPCGFVLSPRTTATNSDGTGIFSGLPSLGACYGYAYHAQADYIGFAVVEEDSEPFDVFGFAPFTATTNSHDFGAAATTLTDGRILVTGGGVILDGPIGGSAIAELYDPSTNSWSSVGPMARRRRLHTSTLLNDGRVLIAGGNDGPNYPLEVEIFNPATGTFSTVGNLAEGRSEATATRRSDGSVIIIGGWNGPGGGNHLNTAERYTAAGVLEVVPDVMLARRYGHSATLLPGDVIVVTGGGVSPDRTTIEILTGDDFTTNGTLTIDRLNASATLLADGRILIVGGSAILVTGGQQSLSSYEFYYPATGVSYAPLVGMVSERREHLAQRLDDGTVVVAGGFATAAPAPPNTVELFDPDQGAAIPAGGREGQFIAYGTLSSGRGYVTAVPLPSDGTPTRFLAIGGAGTSVERFLPRR
jgi:hypothetical protein